MMKACYYYYRQLREELDRWLSQSTRMDIPGPNQGGEDEANYSLAWFPHYLVTANESIAEPFRRLLSDLEHWIKTDCFHGYEPEAEVHSPSGCPHCSLLMPDGMHVLRRRPSARPVRLSGPPG